MSVFVKKLTALAVLLLIVPMYLASAQTTTPDPHFIPEGAPQWVRDLRRWNIVTFGSFPFTMFSTTFGMDMYRWHSANGMDFSDEGRRFAPWPLKSAGAVAMERREHEMTIAIAAGLSVAIGIADLIIVQVRRRRALRRAEAIPVGTYTITRTPLPQEGEDAQDGLLDEEILEQEGEGLTP